ncbi:MAG: NAD(P)-binding domain-containing protein [Actinomycetota bacterium]|nr:NAD(P)-binding domain-containing protein [Actinomycetota bacterium]
MHLLFADSVPDRTIADLESRGHRCVAEPGLNAKELPGRIAGFDVLVVRSTKVSGKVFEAADRLALVIRAGAGTNTIDVGAAADRGVLVANVPGRNSAAVAELTLGLLLAIDRRIADNVADLRQGRWNKKTYGKAHGLLGSTLGIIGLGSVGLCVAERAAAFGVDVQTLARSDRSPETTTRAEALGITLRDSIPELVSTSDIVSLHIPSNAETRHLVDEDFLGRMRPGAILINTSRGDIVEEAALLKALDAGAVRAGLDVFADEPSSGIAEWTSALAQHPAVVATHHIGASTRQAQLAVAAGVVEIVDAFTAGESRGYVNLTPARLGSATLMVRHVDRVGVLARVLDLLSAGGLNVEHMENRIFRGGHAAIASIDVAGQVSDDLLADLGAIPHVLGVSAARLLEDPT